MRNFSKTIAVYAFFLMLCLVLISGCSIGGEKIICTNSDEENGIKEEIEVTAVLSKEKIKKVTAVITYNNKEAMETVCESLKNLPSNELRFSCSGKSIKIKNFDQILSFDSLNSSKEDYIKNIEEEGYNCGN